MARLLIRRSRVLTIQNLVNKGNGMRLGEKAETWWNRMGDSATYNSNASLHWQIKAEERTQLYLVEAQAIVR